MPAHRETTVLQALANPARQAILDVLAQEPSTSAMVARALGSNSGVASYHLRELGNAGLIEHDASAPTAGSSSGSSLPRTCASPTPRSRTTRSVLERRSSW